MQTFLPFSDFQQSAKCLDYRRLGKQRVESMQIINTLQHGSRWKNHPAVLMWGNNIDALKMYCNVMIEEWKRRGYKNNMKLYDVPQHIDYPWWLGNPNFHASHRAALLFKDFNYYSSFGWQEQPKKEYVWPKPLGQKN